MFLISTFSCSWYSPWVGLLELVEQRLNSLCLFEFGQFGRIWELEECRRELHQPLGVDCGDLPHVLLRGLHHLVEDDPLWLSVEQGGAGMDWNNLGVNQGSVAFLRVFLGSISEESRTNCFLNPCSWLSTTDYIQLVSVHDTKQLFPHILSSLQCSLLDKVFITPGCREFVGSPTVEDCQ